MMKTFTVPVILFPVTSPVRKTLASVALVFRAYYAICKYTFSITLQCNYRFIKFESSALGSLG